MLTKYSDINFNYGSNGKDAVVTEMDAIRYSLFRLLKTPVGSVPFNRDYGTSLYKLLFEVSGKLDTTDIKVLLYKEITKWEPRIEMAPLDIGIEQQDVHTYKVTCAYTVPALGDSVSSLTTTVTEK